MPKGPPLRVVIEPLYLEREKVADIMDAVIDTAERTDANEEFVAWLRKLRDRLLDG